MQRRELDNPLYFADFAGGLTGEHRDLQQRLLASQSYPCLLYTSDAADEL